MTELKLIISRLRKPSVLLSILAQILGILAIFNAQIDVNKVTMVATSILGILTLAGILSNPDSKKRGFGDDIAYCETCGKKSQMVKVNGKMVCKDCGVLNKKATKDLLKIDLDNNTLGLDLNDFVSEMSSIDSNFNNFDNIQIEDETYNNISRK